MKTLKKFVERIACSFYFIKVSFVCSKRIFWSLYVPFSVAMFGMLNTYSSIVFQSFHCSDLENKHIITITIWAEEWVNQKFKTLWCPISCKIGKVAEEDKSKVPWLNLCVKRQETLRCLGEGHSRSAEPDLEPKAITHLGLSKVSETNDGVHFRLQALQ